MEILVSERQKGKTIRLILRSSVTKEIIVTPTLCMALYTKDLAKKMGVDIPEPIHPIAFARRIAQGRSTDKYLIDELQSVLDILDVNLATADVNSITII